MAVQERETVVVDGDRNSSSYGWLIALGVIVLLVILFFAMGGMNMFNRSGNTVNVQTPDTVKVQPSQP